MQQIDDDYQRLLKNGYLAREITPQEQDLWRTQIRQRARADRLRLRTGATTRPSGVWAALLDWEPTAGERGAATTW